jgi:hypothetical protein
MHCLEGAMEEVGLRTFLGKANLKWRGTVTASKAK